MIKTLRVSDKTHERIVKHGNYDETMDELLNRLLDKIEKKR